MRFLRLIFVASALAIFPAFACGQPQEGSANKQETPTPEADVDSFFSGFVTDHSAAKITVSRVVLGRPAEKRTFLITHQTKVEGKLKNKARVTVRFASTDDGDVATAILVRASQKNK